MNPSPRVCASVVCVLALSAAVFAGCRPAEKTEVEVDVRSVGFDAASHGPVVLLEDRSRGVALPIWIGPAEAESIAMQMQGVSPPRPMTHDLIKAMLEGAGVEFDKVLIRDLKGSTYYANIYLRAGRRALAVDSRPSDAIALAVRFHRPIFVSAGLLSGSTAIDLRPGAMAGTTIKYSGVTVQDLTDEIAGYFELPPGSGVIVADVDSDAPAGLKRGDVILEVDGAAIRGVGEFAARMDAVKRGAAAHLSVQRGAARVAVQFAARGR